MKFVLLPNVTNVAIFNPGSPVNIVSQSESTFCPATSVFESKQYCEVFYRGNIRKILYHQQDFFILCELLQLPTAMVTFESLNSIVYFENFKFIVISEALTSMISFALQL